MLNIYYLISLFEKPSHLWTNRLVYEDGWFCNFYADLRNCPPLFIIYRLIYKKNYYMFHNW